MKLITNHEYNDLLECKKIVDRMYQLQWAIYKDNESRAEALQALWIDWARYMQESIASTKNVLLLDQKRVTNAVDIAYRDWAIQVCDILIKKLGIIIDNSKPIKPLY